MSLQRNQTELVVQRNLLVPLVAQLGSSTNVLSRHISSVEGAGTAQDALAWLETRRSEEQQAWRDAGLALSTPLLVAHIKLIVESETVFDAGVVVTSWDENATLYMVEALPHSDGLAVRRLRDRPTFVDTLRLYLAGEHPLARSRISLQLTQSEFTALLGLMELLRWRSYEALLSHKPMSNRCSIEELSQHLTSQRMSMDERWVIPFVSALGSEPDGGDEAKTLEQSLDHLENMGLLSWTDDDRIRLDEGSTFVYHGLREPSCMLRLAVTTASAGGDLTLRRTAMFRGASSLWYADMGEHDADPVQLSTIELDAAGATLDRLLTPTGEPCPTEQAERNSATLQPRGSELGAEDEPRRTCSVCGAAMDVGVRFCGNCGASVADAPNERHLSPCPSCGAMAAAEARFCGNCGQRLT